MSKYKVISKIWVVIIVGFVTNFLAFSSAQIKVDITRGNVDPMPIAIPDYGSNGFGNEQLGLDIASVIRNDLLNSGLFVPLDKEKFLEQTSINSRPNFANWRVTQSKALIIGEISFVSDEEIQVNTRLWDIVTGKQISSIGFKTKKSNWRRAAHKVADFTYYHLTGESGYFDTRIVYVSESGKKTHRKKQLMIMDQDGANPVSLTRGLNYEALTPRFSPSQQEITYLALFDDRPAQIYIFNIGTGKQRLLGSFNGMTFAPRFSPDGTRIVFSMSKNGNSDIYIMDLSTRRVRRLTSSPAIDTSPTMSPDGKFIAFASDRGGKQQIYIMSTNGGEAKRITYRNGSYATPVWSPRGDFIAFTRQVKGKFSIGVIRSDGNAERQLVESYHNEGPSWAPNGRYLVFFREQESYGRNNDLPSLWTIDVTGRNLRRIKTIEGASDPAWSPLLP